MSLDLSCFTKSQLRKIIQEIYRRDSSIVNNVIERMTTPLVECPRCYKMEYKLVCYDCQTQFCYSCLVHCSRCAYTGSCDWCPTCNGSTKECDKGEICYRCCVTDERGKYCHVHKCFNDIDSFGSDCQYVSPEDELFQEALQWFYPHLPRK